MPNVERNRTKFCRMKKQKERILQIHNSHKEQSNSSRLSYVRNYFNQFAINLQVASAERISQ